jgi:hypothetical protein
VFAMDEFGGTGTNKYLGTGGMFLSSIKNLEN